MTPPFQITRYESAKQALAEAHTVDEAKDISDKAEALRVYAKQAGDTELELYAAQIRLRARRRLGELSQALDKAPAGRPGKISNSAVTNLTPKTEALAAAGISKMTASRCERLARDITEEDFEIYIAECRQQDKAASSDEIIRRISVSKARAKADDLPRLTLPASGQYRTLVIDPPWPMQKILREVRPNQTAMDYPTMSVDAIKALPIGAIADPLAHLYLWTTQKHLPSAFDLLEAWQFSYLVTMIWHKPGGFQPVGLPQYNAEFIVVGRRGGLPFLSTKNFPVCFTASRREHSRKPDEFYDLVRRVSPQPRIDIFSREPREGFDQFGNEPGRFASAI